MTVYILWAITAGMTQSSYLGNGVISAPPPVPMFHSWSANPQDCWNTATALNKATDINHLYVCLPANVAKP